MRLLLTVILAAMFPIFLVNAIRADDPVKLLNNKILSSLCFALLVFLLILLCRK